MPSNSRDKGRPRSVPLANLALLAFTLLLLVGVDRGLLAYLGLPIWEWDPILHYRHRPSTEASWEFVTRVRMLRDDVDGRDGAMRFLAGREYDVTPRTAARFRRNESAVVVPVAPAQRAIRFNQFGHHDDEFPVEKRARELRGLVIGNSVVMAHNVTASQTFANRLEAELARVVPGYARYQVINTGVQGYATFQYLEVLRRSLRFEPDFVIIGFCMNDITEPYLVNRSFGGTGLDYHGVQQAQNRWIAFLANETGFGRLVLRFRGSAVRRERRERGEVFNVRSMVEGMTTDSIYIKAWNDALADLAEMYAIAEDAGIPVVLAIFPYTFQLRDPASRGPQRLLERHATLHGAAALDFTEIFEAAIGSGALVSDLFLDRTHLTVEGHQVVAEVLLEYLLQSGSIPAVAAADSVAVAAPADAPGGSARVPDRPRGLARVAEQIPAGR